MHLAPTLGLGADIERQREAFRDVYARAELGDWDAVVQQQALLQDYILWPDLRAAYLRTRIGKDDGAIEAYLDRYGALKPARELRYRYALSLARRGAHARFLAVYEAHYTDINEPTLDCSAALAWLREESRDKALELAGKLWLVGRSQAEQCDPLFAELRAEGWLNETRYRARYEVAVDSRQYRLARYLARETNSDLLAEANRWIAANDNAETFLARADVSRHDATYARQLARAATQLGYSDPLRSDRHWRRLARDLNFDPALNGEIIRHNALWAARHHLPEAWAMLDAVPADAADDEVRRWQIRAALRDGQWQRVLDVSLWLSGSEAQRESWRYWTAIAQQQLGNADLATAKLESIAKNRSYYGFLAADQLNMAYPLLEQSIVPDEALMATLARRPELIRARELFRVGLDGRARSEWDAVLDRLSTEETVQAALLAQRWNWHSRAISGAAKAGHYDDLALRYPLPHREIFKASASESGVRESWAYGIARNESLFMRDVRSGAGAVGLMQLMPKTGRQTARELKTPFRGRDTLIDPSSNVRLGTRYLANISDRFGNHKALATAAYNAGPTRVSRWLPTEQSLDARIWIENIPYNETRRYVRRVLTADVIFQWRLTGTPERLSTQLSEIAPTAEANAAPGQPAD